MWWWRMHICIMTHIFHNFIHYWRNLQFRINLWLSSVIKDSTHTDINSYVWTLRISLKIFKILVDYDKLDTSHLSLILTLASCPWRVKIVEESPFAPSCFQHCGRVKKCIVRSSKISRACYGEVSESLNVVRFMKR